MICKVIETIEKYAMLKDVRSVCVGLSGGADSVCLLHILSRLKARYGIILTAVHLNHNLRGADADADETFVRGLCLEWGVPLTVYSEDIRGIAADRGIGLEQCGREVRYECFAEAESDAVATAHTLSDSMETMIFNLLRGTGLRGIASIPPKREPNIIRPLIECTRQEIEKYCADNSLTFVTDESNLSDDYTRNYIRHNIIPSFERVNGSYEASLCRTAEIIRGEEDYLHSATLDLLKEARTDGGYLCEVLSSAHPALRRRALTEILGIAMVKSVENRHVSLLDEAVMSGEGKIQVAKGLYITVGGGIITLQRKKKEAEHPIWSNTDGLFITPKGSFYLATIENPEALLPEDIDAEKLEGTLLFSPRREGDTFFSKRRKQTKTVKKLFNEMKIPREERDLIPILRCDRGAVWIFGVGTDGNYAADEGTEKIVRIIKKEG